MSDPVSKSEIEDILSSIRRLVSEDIRFESRRAPVSRSPATGSRPAVPEAVPEKDRLVLTPALRVAAPPPEGDGDRQTPEVSAPAELTDEAAADREGDAPLGDEPWSDPKATLFEVARAAFPDSEPWEGRDSAEPAKSDEPLAPDSADRILQDILHDAGISEPAVQDRAGDAAERGEEPASAEGSSDWADSVAAGLLGEMAAGFARDAGGEEPPAPDAGGQGEAASEAEEAALHGAADPVHVVADDPVAEDGGGQVEPGRRDDHAGDDDLAAFEGGTDRSGEAVAEAGAELDDPTATAARAETLAAKIQALEAAIGRSRDMWEPDGAGGDDYAGTPVQTIAWEDHEDAGAGAEDAPETDPESETDILAADEAVLDEASLRELVSEIVREELQGALGERITRNVRKLVRREIHRALTMRNFE